MKTYETIGDEHLRRALKELDDRATAIEGRAVVSTDNIESHYGALDGAYWDDLRVPVTSTRKGGNDPGFSLFMDDGGGPSRGVFIEWFDDSAIEELFFSAQMPHGWIPRTPLKFHVHWVPAALGGAGQFVRWGLEYTWADIGEDFPNTTIIYSDATTAQTATVQQDDPLVAGRHYYTILPDIEDTAITGVSSMLVCRVFRDATDLTDDYVGDAGLMEVDFHYQRNSLGSIVEFRK